MPPDSIALSSIATARIVLSCECAPRRGMVLRGGSGSGHVCFKLT